MSGYTVPPPGYVEAGPSTHKKPQQYGATGGEASAAEPLLAGEGLAARNAWEEDGEGLEDDFKVRSRVLTSF